MKLIKTFLLTLLTGFLCIACNRDNEITADPTPVITFDSPDGIYTVKPGEVLTITPHVEYDAGLSYEWYMDGSGKIGSSKTLSYQWEICGDYLLTFVAKREDVSVSEDVLVRVMDATPPVVYVPQPEGGWRLRCGETILLTAQVKHADMPDFYIRWTEWDDILSETMECTFSKEEPGMFEIEIEAGNIDGRATVTLKIEVAEKLPIEVSFPALSYLNPSPDRTILLGRKFYITPDVEDARNPEYSWYVNSRELPDEHGSTLVYVPYEAGRYTIKVVVEDSEQRGEAEMILHCIDAEETTLARPEQGTSSIYQTRVYEYIPAPGQFIGDTSTAGFPASPIIDATAAAEYARQRLEARKFVSLGSFGGYIILGFDHSILREGKIYDFAVYGNALDTSNEPGIVWVMQDVNGNGEPDDEWYRLKGSEEGLAGSSADFRITYFAPPAENMGVSWIDQAGISGTIDYISTHHTQPFYYPGWVAPGSYRLRGAIIKARTSGANGFWDNAPFAWGYTDNKGDDLISPGDEDGMGQATGLSLGNAVYPDGTAVELRHIDFVKIQTGVLSKSGNLGEVSTEVVSVRDL